jgi:hypothetical protein
LPFEPDQASLNVDGALDTEPNNQAGQTFTVQVDGFLAGIEVSLDACMHPLPQGTVVVINVTDFMTGTFLGASTPQPIGGLDTNCAPPPLQPTGLGDGFVDFTQSSCLPVAGGQILQFSIMTKFPVTGDCQSGSCVGGFVGSDCMADSDCYNVVVGYSQEDDYNGGNAFLGQSPIAGNDLAFKTFVIPAGSGP